MSEVTRILSAIRQGDPQAAGQLLPLVYDELRRLAAQRLAQERPGQTLQATALVHEAYLRLVDQDQAQLWNSRGHFFAAAAEAMRRILVEGARRKGRAKRGGGLRRLDLEGLAVPADDRAEELLALDDALEPGERSHVVYDLGEVRGLDYYTGVHFEVFVSGAGRAAGAGGRYDELMGRFGRPMPAVGVSIDLDAIAEVPL